MELQETSTSSNSAYQEKFMLQALSNFKGFIIYKLGSVYRDAVEDITQKVFCKLWSWKNRNNKELDYEEWQKVINVTVHRELAEFFSQKYRQDLLFSQALTNAEESFLTNNSFQSFNYYLEGNTEAETRSLLLLIWKGLQTLSLRQRSAFLLHNSDLLTELIIHKCCRTSEIAEILEMSEAEMSLLLNFLPIEDEKIILVLETKLKQTVTPHQLWEARSKAKKALLNFIKKNSRNSSFSFMGLLTSLSSSFYIAEKIIVNCNFFEIFI